MDGNAQNMFHGNHQGDAYYRYDAAAAAAATPRAMGPPGGYPRHRPPHPLQQQPQYPSYQPSAENIYAMGTDQHTGMGMGDLGGWGSGPTPGQAGAYPGPGLGAYGHPQTSPSPQRQAQSQPGYRQHISAYPQQEQQKLSFSTQQSMMGGMMQQPGYVALNQQQSQQQRIPQHYPQAGSHPMYPGAPQAQSTAQPYGPYGATSMQHQPGRPPQHVAYSHASLDQASYGQHVPSSAAPGHHLGNQQQPPQLGHPPQTQQSHIGQPSQNHMPVPGQTQPQPLHPSQVVHPSQQPTHPSTNQSTLPGLPPNLQSGPTVSQQQPQTQTSTPQPQNIMSTQHLHAPGPGPQSHQGLLHPNPSVVTSQHQTSSGSHSIPHSLVSGYTVQHQSQQQQSPYMSTAKPQPTTQLSSSPQYRAPFPQLSPQMSPRPPQMSPHPQMSPRPVMSPAKPQSQSSQMQSNPPNTPSPHHPSGLSGMTSPRPPQQQPQPIQPPSKNTSNVPPGPVNTLQALEQMVMPSQNSMSVPGGSLDYPQYRQQPIPTGNAMSPMGPRMPMSPQHHQQWTPLMNMQPPSSASLGSLSTQSPQQHLYAQSLSHQAPPPQPQPPPSNQQLTPPQLNEQLQHSINDITGHQQQQQQLQPVPVSQVLPPSSVNQQTPPQHLTPPHQHLTPPHQHLTPPHQHLTPPHQHLTPLQVSNTLQPISHDSNSPISEPHLMSPVKSNSSTPIQESQTQNQQSQQQQQPQLQQQPSSLIDSFLIVMESSSPQLKTLESNSNDSSHLVNNDTNSSNSIVNNQPSSVSAHDSNSNPLNQNLFTVPVDTNSSHVDYENSNHAPVPLQPIALEEDTVKEEAPKECFQEDLESPENSQDLTELHQMQPAQLQSPTSTENNSNQQSDIQSNENFSTEKISEDIREIGDMNTSATTQSCHTQPPDIQSIAQKSPEMPQAPILNQIQPPPLPVQQPSLSQPTTQQSPVLPSIPPIQTQTTLIGPVPNQHMNQAPGIHTIPPSHHVLPPGMTQLSNPPQVYDSQQQLILGPVHPGLPTPGIPGMPPGNHHMAPTIIPPHGIPPYPPGPLSHHQERAALQQQLQELYCMPQGPEQQEKIMRVQERLNMLQQHESTDQCNGGAQCILQSPLYSNTQMIESPQVSSTTGRGRSKGTAKPRKPRQKKSDKVITEANTETNDGNTSIISALPVSEDCVTQGAGDTSVVGIMEYNEMGELSQDNSSNEILDTSTEPKKPKKPRKPRAPKDPNKSPKEKVPKEKKEKKTKEPKDPNDPDKPKKKRGKKTGENKIEGAIIEDSSILNTTTEIKAERRDESNTVLQNSELPLESVCDNMDESKINTAEEPRSTLHDENPDFDDIPVSKIPNKVGTSSDETPKKEETETSQEGSTEAVTEGTVSKKKKKSSSSSKKRPSFGKPNKKRKNRGRIVPESDGEADDMVTTPPPSPPPDSELDSSKRRSARNTQRKKYIDDVMLRFSDDESGLISSSPSKKDKKPPTSGTSSDVEKTENNVTIDGEKISVENVEEVVEKEKSPEEGNKPNYVYVNTNDEDSMVVQYVLAVRIGKREAKPNLFPEAKKENPKTEDEEIVEESAEPKSAESELDAKTESVKTEGLEESETCEEEEPKEQEVESVKEDSAEKKESMEEDQTASEEDQTASEEDQTALAEDQGALAEDQTASAEEPAIKMEVDEDVPSPETKAKPDDTDTEEKPETDSSEENKVVQNEEEGEKEKQPPTYVEIEEYLVKYRNFSYLHCEWRTEEELFKGDRRIASKIKRFQMKQTQQMNIFDNIEEEPFNPDFVEVDRVLDVSEHVDATTGEKSKHYLVKWKSLPYEDCTWELKEDVDEVKIEQFYKFNKVPPKSEWKAKKRPAAELWKKLDETPIYKNNNTLRPYQLEGLNWLKFSWYNGHNCILADEMGLGKTIQSLTFVHSVWEYGIRGPFLVIAPLSTIPNWQREFESWTDMNVIVYHGSVTSKQMLQEYEYHYKNESGKVLKDFIKFNVLITTFEMIVTDYQDLSSFNWRVCVIDEAHRLKNRNCKLLEGLRQLNLEHRVLLSGTPLQNNVNELFSLLNFLEPTQFSCAETFLNEFGSLKTESEVQKLQALLKPMMLRRLKDDVEKSLAPKEETIVEVELTNIQKKYYRGILEQNFSFLKKGTTSANIPNLMNTMMELRKCCIHPYLLNGAEDQIQYDYRIAHGDDHDAYYKNLVNSAGKMVLIDKLLPKLKANGHRVLIFSQMVRCLDILEDYLMYRKYPFERIDGRIRGNLRQAAIDRFSKPDSDRFVFLLCTKAGGLGINLTAADTVIIYDSDWNPQNDLQAQARCHRIGQQKMVKIYRLLCRNTYEREMFDKASLKLGLDKAILQSMNTVQGGKDSSNRQLSKKEIEDLLKKGAYGAVMDDDNAGDKFCEEDIDSILKRRTQVITMEYEKGSTFSKASFAASGNRSDIKIDDPDFWNKWAKKADFDPNACERDEAEDLVISEPRRRTQIKRYGHDDGVMDMSEDSSVENSDEDSIGLRSRRRKEKLARRKGNDDYIPRDRDTLAALGLDEIQYGSWAKSECFKVEKGLLSYGWGRWAEIQELGQFKRGWRESDIEDCARIILLYCLHVYKGDEKIKNFIWDLITPTEDGEVQKISRDHSGLHNLVPRGRNAKGRNGGKSGQKDPQSKSQERDKIPGGQNIMDPNHWSKEEKYDADIFLEGPYKKHLGRHANKVLLRVRMLYYIQHEVIGDLVQQIHEGVNASELPIRPPTTPDQMPSSWWNPNCCDKSLLVGTYKHGCEMYRQIRADPTLCFSSHIGPGDDAPVVNANNDDDANSKHEDADDVDDDGTATKDSDSKTTDAKDSEIDRPSSSGLEEEDITCYPPTNMPSDDTTWPSMQDLNTRLRRVITSYQRNYKKEELKQQQKAKLQALVSTPSVSTSTSSTMGGVQVITGAVATPTNSSAVPSMSTTGGITSIAGGVVSTSSAANCGQLTTTISQAQSQASQMPSAADIGLMLSLLNPVDASQLANLDLNKLAMYLKMERQGKMEQAAKERERARLESIPKKWNRREEYEFLRVLTGYGIDLQQSNIIAPDWSKFKTMSRLERKSDETLSDYYKVFIAMCKRQAGVKLTEGEKGLEGIIDDISEDHAKLVLDRLELLSKLREISRHPLLDERLKLCQNNFDTPDWWESGKHDKELISAVLKHGLYRSECFIFNDPMFSFIESERRFARELEAQIQRNVKIESLILPHEVEDATVIKEEIIEEVKIEKSEDLDISGTDDIKELDDKSIEDSISKKQNESTDSEDPDKSKESDKEKLDTSANDELKIKSEPEESYDDSKNNENQEQKEEAIDLKKESEEEGAKKESELLDLASSGDPDDDEVMKEKEKAVEEECKKQAAELKARFPDLEVIQPQVKIKIEKERPKIENMMVVRWFRDFALEKRISHIVTCVEKNQWPVGKNYSAYTGCQGMDLDIPLYETVTHTTNILDRRSNTPDVITITTDQGVPKHLQAQLSAPSTPTLNPMAASANNSKKRKRHIAIDVETERAKLHALLNSTQISISGQKSSWEEEPDTRRSTPSLSLQPPPAHQHQHQPLTRQTSTSFNKPQNMKSTTSSSMAPIDLSSSLPKVSMSDMMKSPIDLSEVQDFSMSSKKSVSNMNVGYGGAPGKGKLDDTLTKLMKKNNCTIEEPVVGKEKKRKKLDEIVLGLSAAKEQKTFPDPSLPSSKKQPITPSVSVTPANVPSSSPSNQQNQKPFTITVTSVPGTPKSGQNTSSSSSSGTPSGLAALQNMAMGGTSNVSSKDSLNALLAQTMQTDPQTFLKQQQKMMQQLPASQRKAYEGMLAEMKQAMELSSKYSSHDAKVNKWLAEQQNAALNEQLNMDYRRSTRQHSSNVSVPTSMPQSAPQQSLGPKNLTGEEPVPVIHKQTGKRIASNKAPQLKRLMQWLSENPAYEVDPKWLEHIQNPMSAPSPKPPMDTSGMSAGTSGKGHGRSSSGSSTNSSASMGGQQQPSKKGRPSAMDQANAMQFASLAGLNPNLLSGLPGLGAFDPKNPLLMPFAGMPSLGGMAGLGNLNNMNLFANLAGLGGLGNLAGMDAQSLAALMAAANTAGLGNLTGTTKSGNSQSGNKKGKQSNESQQQNSSQGGQSNKIPTSSASSSASANNSAFPFLFPNPSLLYPPLGLGSLNPYSLSSGMSAYDQLAQQYNLLNGAGVSGNTTSTSNVSSTRQSQSKSTSSRTSALSSASMGGGTQQSSSSGRGRGSSRAAENSQLSSLLMPTADPHLLESLSRMAGMDIAQASRLMSGGGGGGCGGGQSGVDKRPGSSMSKESHEKQIAKENQKWMESLARGALPPDLAAIQAFTQGKMPSTSSKGNSKNSQMPLPLPTDISQAFLAEMAAQAMAAAASTSSSSSKRSRDQEMKDAFEQFSKQQMDLYTRTLGLGSGISLIPTSAAPVMDDHKSKRSRSDSHTSNSSKDDMTTIPLNLGGEKGLRGGDATSMDKVTLTPVAAASIAASLPSQTTITIAPPISSGASTSSGCSEGRSGLTISSSADTPISSSGSNKQAPSDTEIEDLVIQKQSKPSTPVEHVPVQLSQERQQQQQVPQERQQQHLSSQERQQQQLSQERQQLQLSQERQQQQLSQERQQQQLSQERQQHQLSQERQQQLSQERQQQQLSQERQQQQQLSQERQQQQLQPPSPSPIIDIQPAINIKPQEHQEEEHHHQQRAEERRSGRLKRPRSGIESSDVCPPPEKRRELRSTVRTRQSGHSETLNLSTSADDKSDSHKD